MKRFLVVFFFSLGLSLSVFAFNLVITGSTTVLPIAQQWAQAYMAQHPEIRISVVGNGSGNGIKALLDGLTNIADSSRWMKNSEIRLAESRGFFPFPIVVAYDAIAPVVNVNNPVRNLSLEQLKGIYEGKITRWSQVGGPDMPIVVVQRDNSSGTHEVWEEKVMKGALVTARALTVASNAEVVRMISQNKKVIGYVGIGYMESSTMIADVAISGIKATIAAARAGKYPLARPLFMITRGIPNGEVSKFIINFGLSPAGQEIVKKVGFIPIYRLKK